MVAVTTTRARFGRTTGVSFDLQGALSVQRDLGLLADRLPWLQERAIRTLRRALPVEARRDIQRQYNIRAARVRDHLVARTYTDGTARLAGVRLIGQWKRGIGLINFSANQTRKGVTYRVYRDGRRGLIEGAFIARLMGRPAGFIGPVRGNMHAVERSPLRSDQRERIYRQKDRQGRWRTGTRTDGKLVVLYRSTVAQMLASGNRPEKLRDYARAVMEREVERQLQIYLRRPGAT